MGPLHECDLQGFFVKARELVKWKCVPLLISYCCDSPEGREVSGARHDVALNRPYVKRIVTAEDIINGWMAHDRSVKETRMVRRSLLQYSKNNNGSVSNKTDIALEEMTEWGGVAENVLAIFLAFLLEKFMISRRIEGEINCSLLTVELLNNVHLGIYKLVKKCTVR